MTLDLFADPVPTVVAHRAKEPAAQVKPMEGVLGDPGRWNYRGEVILHDGRRVGQGAWWTVEGIGRPCVESDDLAVVQAEVDRRAAAGALGAG